MDKYSGINSSRQSTVNRYSQQRTNSTSFGGVTGSGRPSQANNPPPRPPSISRPSQANNPLQRSPSISRPSQANNSPQKLLTRSNSSSSLSSSSSGGIQGVAGRAAVSQRPPSPIASSSRQLIPRPKDRHFTAAKAEVRQSTRRPLSSLSDTSSGDRQRATGRAAACSKPPSPSASSSGSFRAGAASALSPQSHSGQLQPTRRQPTSQAQRGSQHLPKKAQQTNLKPMNHGTSMHRQQIARHKHKKEHESEKMPKGRGVYEFMYPYNL